MFEFLRDTAPREMVMGVHHTLNLLTHRTHIKPESRKDLESTSFQVPREAQEVAFRILDEIARVEQKPVNGLTDERVDKYLKDLGLMVEKSVAERGQYDPKRGQTLLEHFRHSSPVQTQRSEIDRKAETLSNRFNLGSRVIRFITVVIENLGWPGLLILSMLVFVVAYATPEQKQQLIDTYLLGKGIQTIWHVLIFFGLAILALLAQFMQTRRQFRNELKRLSVEKSLLQEVAHQASRR